MSKSKCHVAHCDKSSTVHFIRVEGRAVVEERSMCDEHGQTHVASYFHDTIRETGAGLPLTIGTGTAFEVDFLFLDELQCQPEGLARLELKEVGGPRRFSMRVDTYVWLTLNSELRGYPLPRPPTHRALSAVITALGGKLQYVELDCVHPADEYIYDAKLHIQQLNKTVLVDLRPSDAMVQAVLANVPIIISKDVLDAIAQKGQRP